MVFTLPSPWVTGTVIDYFVSPVVDTLSTDTRTNSRTLFPDVEDGH